MSDLCRLIWCALIGLFRPRAALEAEIVVLRHQLNVLRRKSQKRVELSNIDRLLLVGLYRLAPGVLDALKIIRPETLIRWHRGAMSETWGVARLVTVDYTASPEIRCGREGDDGSRVAHTLASAWPRARGQ